MLILQREVGEAICIGDMEVKVDRIVGDVVELAIALPPGSVVSDGPTTLPPRKDTVKRTKGNASENRQAHRRKR